MRVWVGSYGIYYYVDYQRMGSFSRVSGSRTVRSVEGYRRWAFRMSGLERRVSGDSDFRGIFALEARR